MVNKNKVESDALMIRIDSLEQVLLRAAAARHGVSLARFITEAALHYARNPEQISLPAVATGDGVPQWFRDLCERATLGGAFDYGAAGFELVNALLENERVSRPPGHVTENEWQRELNQLRTMVRNHIRMSDRLAELGNWFDSNLPQYMALIPERRRRAFFTGVQLFSKQYGRNVP